MMMRGYPLVIYQPRTSRCVLKRLKEIFWHCAPPWWYWFYCLCHFPLIKWFVQITNSLFNPFCRCQDSNHHRALEYPSTYMYSGFNSFVELIDQLYFERNIPRRQMDSYTVVYTCYAIVKLCLLIFSFPRYIVYKWTLPVLEFYIVCNLSIFKYIYTWVISLNSITIFPRLLHCTL